MDTLTALAASGMRSRTESLDILANNLANAGAPGFKADREFYNVYVSADAASGDPRANLAEEPVTERHWTDFAQGSLATTGNPLDIALSGKGFLGVDSPGGPLYTRDGNLRISPRGLLETQDSYPLRSVNGKPIVLDRSKQVEIGPNGMVRQDGLDVAQLEIVDVRNVADLSKKGGNYFGFSGSAPPPPSKAEVLQGKIETANFQPAESAVRIIAIMRQFEGLQKAMSVAVDMNRKATDDIARVS